MLEGLDLSGARILIVDDVPASLEMLRRALEEAGYQVLVAPSGEVALQIAGRARPDLILLDVLMPGMDGFAVCRQLKDEAATREIPVLFLTARDESEGVVRGFAAGGLDYIVKPFQKEEVLARIRTHLERAKLLQVVMEKNRVLEGEIARRRQLAGERDHLAEQLSHLAQSEDQRWGLYGLVGQSLTLRRILGDIDLLQNAQNLSVLICGESGTGKELIARAIHKGSACAKGPFLPVNCSAIPRELAESLFFGHAKGAFSGAERDQAGYFELAHGGILFLDEIGDLPLELQPKLLRVLEDGMVLPLGARESRKVEVRVLAATNADLEAQVAGGHFRRDLYYRLARFTVQVPPLRERREDIGLLARHFLQLFAAEMGIEYPTLSAEALALLEAHDFPGNVRELKNLVERALIQSRDGQLRSEHLALPLAAQTAASAVAPWVGVHGTLDEIVEVAEKLAVQHALARSQDNVAAAARLLGTNRMRLYRILGREE